MILPAGHGPRQSDAYSQARLVKDRLRRWKEGAYEELWKEAVNLTKPQTKKKRKKGSTGEKEKSLEERNATRACQLAQDGQYKRSLQALDSAGMADWSNTTEE